MKGIYRKRVSDCVSVIMDSDTRVQNAGIDVDESLQLTRSPVGVQQVVKLKHNLSLNVLLN